MHSIFSWSGASVRRSLPLIGVNKEIVNMINQHGGMAVGLSGKDGQLILAKKMNVTVASANGESPEIIDISMVGEIIGINPLIIDSLDANYKILITLRYQNELSYDEIASTLNLPLGTVKTGIFRAKEQLRKSLALLEDSWITV